MSIQDVGVNNGYDSYRALLRSFRDGSSAAFGGGSSTATSSTATTTSSTSTAPGAANSGSASGSATKSSSRSSSLSGPVSPSNLVQAQGQGESFVPLAGVTASLPDGLTIGLYTLEGVRTGSDGSQQLVTANPKGDTPVTGSEPPVDLSAMTQAMEQMVDHFMGRDRSSGQAATASAPAASAQVSAYQKAWAAPAAGSQNPSVNATA